jgi:hypothetical protein
MKQFVTNLARNSMKNNPGLTYNLGQCKRLFVRPWLAWRCAYKVNFGGSSVTHCQTLTISIKRLAEASYRGTVRDEGGCSHS